MSRPPVRTGTAADRDQVASLLARAFQDDPLYRWLIPDDETRLRRLPGLMRAFLRQLHRPATIEIAGTAGAALAASVWDEPGAVDPGPLATLASVPGLLRATGRRFPDLARLGDIFGKARPGDPHWYLFHLGTEPRSQGTGAGTTLLRSMLDRCDAAGTPAYLECKPELVSYYGRVGFHPIGDLHVPGLPVTMTSMWRTPGQG